MYAAKLKSIMVLHGDTNRSLAREPGLHRRHYGQKSTKKTAQNLQRLKYLKSNNGISWTQTKSRKFFLPRKYPEKIQLKEAAS